MYMCCGISNVVVSLTIHDNMFIYLFIRDVAKKRETIVEGQRLLQPNIMESV